MVNFEIYKICVIAAIFSLVIPVVSAYSEELETLQIEIKTTGGDRAGTFKTNYIIYQDSEKSPYLENFFKSNPEFITLPKDHKYKIEVYGNGMYATIAYVELTESKKLDISIPQSGGLKFNVFFERGEKPIDGATVVIKSNDGQEQAVGKTNENGDTMRHWLQSTNRDEDFYLAEVFFDEFLLASFSNVKILHSIQQDQKIVVPVPAVVEDLITFRLYDTESDLILKNQGNFSVLLVGNDNIEFKNRITANQGDIYFSSIPSGAYSASVLRDGVRDPLWSDTRIAITGNPNNFDLIQRNPLDPVSSPTPGPVSDLLVPSDSEELETLQIEIRTINGDRAGIFKTNYIIYQDSKKSPYLENFFKSNPEFITLPKDHKYKIEVYGNGMYAEVGSVLLNESKKLDISIPQSGGVKFNVLFEKGEKPIENATVVIKSNDGQEQAVGKTDEHGDTVRYWLQSTNRAEDYYVVEVYFEEFLLTSISNVKIQQSIQQDQKIVVPIPQVVEELITFRILDTNLNKIFNNNADFSVLLTDQNNNQYEKSFISKNGEIFFSSIPSGMYSASVLRDGVKDPHWTDARIAIAGYENNFDLIQTNFPTPIPVPFSNPIPDLTIDPVANPVANPVDVQVADALIINNVIIPFSEIYVPSTISVNLLETITWTNEDDTGHTVTSKTSGLFNSGWFGTNQSFSHQFTEEGAYDYFCDYHPWMTGTVIVENGGDVSTLPEPDQVPEVAPSLVPSPVAGPSTDPVIYYQESNTLSNTLSDKLSCNCVSFKLDSVEDFWLNKAQQELIKQFSKHNVPLTVGVSVNMLGEDDMLVDIVKKGIISKDLTIANHGMDNTSFISLDKQKQSVLLKESTNKIFEEFHVTPKIFIPPLYQFNDDTKQALLENGYTHISAGQNTDLPPYPLQGESLYRFPTVAFTGVYSTSEERVLGVSSDKTFSAVLDGIDKFGYAIIALSPQEFSVYRNGGYVNVINRDQFSELNTLMERINAENIDVVSIDQINKNVFIVAVPETLNDSLDSQLIPGWIKNTAGWWRDGHIDDNSFVQGIQFLIKEEILQIPPTTQGSGGSEIPSWVKDTAGWWAEGIISDDDFIYGIDFLINQGIIIIEL